MSAAAVTHKVTLDAATHEYRLDGVLVPGVTTILKDAGLIDSQWFTEQSAWKGSVAHAACQLDDQNDLDESTVSESIRGHLEAWRKFKAESGFRVELIEHSVYSPTWRYAGTLDRTGMIGASKVLLDLKTGAHEPWHALQLAAYAWTFERPRALRRFAVRLTKDGAYRVQEYPLKDLDNDFAVFGAAFTVAGWRRAKL